MKTSHLVLAFTPYSVMTLSVFPILSQRMDLFLTYSISLLLHDFGNFSLFTSSTTTVNYAA
ncbi:hypothetical protein K450DRAFT_224839 [Umbelopsis ramanniana AG]|uniref:Uncharacterized protein n=1 Tax=Umbelopsis ramanniana AG TaxID=1314678 RepID=A0AAD5HI23_UMBRA|nr:uncharacterized protein K450DRAFT_224839 [Umbelopsis ramanniana AG]KAI8583231.1 hypothetical protein K450DRAFT_224839 [Umbelopsis ramanniana AG]